MIAVSCPSALQLLQEARIAFAAHHDIVGQIRAQLVEGWTYQCGGPPAWMRSAPDRRVMQRIWAIGLIGTRSMRRQRAWWVRVSMAWAMAGSRALSGSGAEALSGSSRLMNGVLSIWGARCRIWPMPCVRWAALEEAATLQSESLGLWREIGNPASAGALPEQHGLRSLRGWRLRCALTLYTEALLKAEEAEDRRVQAWITEGIATTYRDRGEFDRALEIYARIFSLTGSIGDQALVSLALDGLGHTHRLAEISIVLWRCSSKRAALLSAKALQAQVNLSTASMGIARIEQGDMRGRADLERASRALRRDECLS